MQTEETRKEKRSINNVSPEKILALVKGVRASSGDISSRHEKNLKRRQRGREKR
jgi:hypothetical protein